MTDNDQTDPPNETKSNTSFLDKMTGTTAKITAFLVAITAMLAAVPPITEGIKTIYCGVRVCSGVRDNGPPADQGEIMPSTLMEGKIDGGPNFPKDAAPTNISNPLVVNACYTTVLWNKEQTTWRVVVQDDTLYRGASLSWMYSDIADEDGLSAALTPLVRNVDYSNSITLPSKTINWDIDRWPDGTSTSACIGPPYPPRFPMSKRKYGHRVNFWIPATTAPGRYVLFLRNEKGAIVTNKDVAVR